MRDLVYLDIDEIVETNRLAAERKNEVHKTQNREMLEIAQQEGATAEDAFHSAAVLMWSILQHNIFASEGGATALACTFAIAKENGYDLVMTEEEYNQIIRQITTGKMGIAEIAEQLEEHCRDVAQDVDEHTELSTSRTGQGA